MNAEMYLRSRVQPKLRKGFLRLLLFLSLEMAKEKTGYPAIRDATEETSHGLGCMVTWPPGVFQSQDPLSRNQGKQDLNKLPHNQLKSVWPYQILSRGPPCRYPVNAHKCLLTPQPQGSAEIDTFASFGTKHIHL